MLSEEARLIEVVLFIENEPTSMERLCDLTNLRPDTVEDALQELRENYAERGSGLILTEEDELYSFMPAPDLFPQLRQSYGRKVDRRLSRAAMETLAIVAYKQPVTRKEIKDIRGVDSDSIVKLLREKDYIKVVGRSSQQGHPCLYSTTRKFLFEFKLTSIADLPKLSEVDRRRFEKEEEYNDMFATPYQAAKYGYIDDVIEPRNTRFRICRALAQLSTKRESLPAKKHGNIPM